HVQVVGWALCLLACVGLVGGLLVVPLNALLQHRGFVLLSAGRSVAVQGFNENLSVLCMLGLYAVLVAAEMPIVPLMTLFGLSIALAMTYLFRQSLRSAPARSL
ncbi:MAG: lysophospholipid transporter LplT, partial [Betaproteobacteria bacterium]|nr:lysophospholipid transporter LplT [Betaproteobacteria bacterium]NDE73087.1 lysophospholipid transporter LplT [Betaproteobacteria bacterium]